MQHGFGPNEPRRPPQTLPMIAGTTGTTHPSTKAMSPSIQAAPGVAPAAASPPAVTATAAAAAAAGTPQYQHLSHEDYDWMGVLDSLEVDEHHQRPLAGGHPHRQRVASGADEIRDGKEAAAAAAAAAARVVDHIVPSSALMMPSMAPKAREGGDNREPMGKSPSASESGGGAIVTSHITTAHIAAAAAAAAPGKQLPRETSETANSKDSSEEVGAAAAIDPKRQSRIERKRSREKQRRLDTNSQFAALAEIVREIEAVDLVEEARFNLNLKQQLVGRLHGIKSVGAAPSPVRPPSTSTPDGSDPKKLKLSDSEVLSPTSAAAAAAAGIAAFNPSNRVDLIARTIAQLNQLRMIRRRRNEELRDARRRECEMRKEVEELRRVVAHYKAVGIGQRPQEKVMMMVPMMVPQDAVSQIASGYPAAHQYAGVPSHQSFAGGTAPWMGSIPSATSYAPHAAASMGHGVVRHLTLGSAALPHNQAALALPPANAGLAPSGGQPQPAPGGAVAMPSPAPHLQPYSVTGHPSAVATTSVPPPSGAPHPGDGTSPSARAASAAGQQQQVPPLPPSQGALGQAPAPSQYAMAHMQAPATSINPTPAETAASPSMSVYPQVNGGAPSVSFGAHSLAPTSALAHAHAAALQPPQGAQAPASLAPTAMTAVNQQQQQQQQQPSHGGSLPHLPGAHAPGPTMAPLSLQQQPPAPQPMQQQPPAPPLQQSPSTDKPSPRHQPVAGSNLAHCA